MQVHVLNGPNLNLLGERDPAIYGTMSLADIAQMLRETVGAGHEIIFEQTNKEGGLVDLIHRAHREADGLVINAAAYTHTSVAVRDALEVLTIPKIEVHLSNPAAREPFRHVSHVAPVVDGTIAGLGPLGYRLAVSAVLALVTARAD